MRGKWLIVLLFLITIGLVTWASLKQRPVYRASSTVILGAVSQDISAIKDIEESKKIGLSAYNIYTETQREIIRSRRTAYHVIKNLGLRNKGAFKTAKDPIEILLRKLKVDIIKGTGVVRINVEDEDPEWAMRMANEFARVYVSSNNTSRLQDFADVPTGPVRPDKRLNIALSVILGITGGISIVFFWKPDDIKIKDSNDLASLAKLPVLGSVPRIKPDGRNVKTRIDVGRVVEKDPQCMASEAYRSIRSKLLFSLNNSGSIAKSIVITSSAPNAGKTISAINLATMIAHSGESVLLVDIHMKRPKIHAIFNMNNNSGFANYISGEADFYDTVKYPGIDNLAIITAGSSSYKPVESVVSKNTKLFLEKASAGFSKVIFDAPSVASLADVAMLLNICDGVVLIAESGKISKDTLNNSKELLHKRGANIIGVILNKVLL